MVICVNRIADIAFSAAAEVEIGDVKLAPSPGVVSLHHIHLDVNGRTKIRAAIANVCSVASNLFES